jgi:hypothetical protein
MLGAHLTSPHQTFINGIGERNAHPHFTHAWLLLEFEIVIGMRIGWHREAFSPFQVKSHQVLG